MLVYISINSSINVCKHLICLYVYLSKNTRIFVCVLCDMLE